MKEWKVIVATLVIFTAGVVTGGLLVQRTSAKPQRRAPLPTQGQLPPLRESRENRDPRQAASEQRQAYVARLNQELSLRPDQTAGVERVLQDGQQRTRIIWESVQPRMHEELRHTRDEIRALLDEPQRERFDQINLLPPLAKEKKTPMSPKKNPGGAGEK